MPELPESVSLISGRGGLPALAVRSERGEGTIYLQGAHVAEWQPAGADPVLWLSQRSEYAHQRPIRGGIPVCAPWFGPGLDGDRVPPHGWFRLHEWQVVSAEDTDGTVTVTFAIDGAVAHMPEVTAQYVVTMGEALDLELTIAVTSPMVVEEALHTYLAVGDIHRTHVEGLAGATYLDKVAGGEVSQEGPVTFTAQTDRVYDSPGSVTVVDEQSQRRIVVTKENSATTVVWNPWSDKAATMPDFGDDEWPGMVCVEVANAVGRALRLEEDTSHTMRARYAVEPL